MKNMLVIIILVAAISVVGGCRTTAESSIPDAASRRMDYFIEHGDFHRAFLCYDDLVEELKTTGEGALDFEIAQLADTTARLGEKQWTTILKDPRIPLGPKLELVAAIDQTYEEK